MDYQNHRNQNTRNSIEERIEERIERVIQAPTSFQDSSKSRIKNQESTSAFVSNNRPFLEMAALNITTLQKSVYQNHQFIYHDCVLMPDISLCVGHFPDTGNVNLQEMIFSHMAARNQG